MFVPLLIAAHLAGSSFEEVMSRLDHFLKSTPEFKVQVTGTNNTVASKGAGEVWVGSGRNRLYRIAWAGQQYTYMSNSTGGFEMEALYHSYRFLPRGMPLGVPEGIISRAANYASPNLLMTRTPALMDAKGATHAVKQVSAGVDEISIQGATDSGFFIETVRVDKDGKPLRFALNLNGTWIGALDFSNYNLHPGFTDKSFAVTLPAGYSPYSVPGRDDPLPVGARAVGSVADLAGMGKTMIAVLDPTEPDQVAVISTLQAKCSKLGFKLVLLTSAKEAPNGWVSSPGAVEGLIARETPVFLLFDGGRVAQIWLGKSAPGTKKFGIIPEKTEG